MDSSTPPLEPKAVGRTVRTATQEYDANIAMLGKPERPLRESLSLSRENVKVHDRSIRRLEGQAPRLRIGCNALETRSYLYMKAATALGSDHLDRLHTVVSSGKSAVAFNQLLKDTSIQGGAEIKGNV